MELRTDERIKKLLIQTKRKGIENLIEWMEQEGFFDAPCSSKYHLSEPGGLAKHSLNVFRTAIEETIGFFQDNQSKVTFDFIDSITLCALLHDVGKTGQFGKPNYTMCGEGTTATYEINKNLLYIPHEVRSIAILSKFIDLTEEEQYAILYHNGLYGEMKGFKGKETPLLMLLHFADMWASRVVEK